MTCLPLLLLLFSPFFLLVFCLPPVLDSRHHERGFHLHTCTFAHLHIIFIAHNSISMKKLLLPLLLLSGLSTLHAQTSAVKAPVSAAAQVKSTLLQEAAPAAAGMSAEKLARIDALLQDYVDKGWVPGASALVARNGKIVYYKSFGFRNRDERTPLKRDDIFRIASQTKAITSVGVMMLMDEGKLLLDDPLSKYIPEFGNLRVLDQFNEKDTTYTTVPAKRGITVRDLLTHTSGIGYAQIGSKQMNAIYAKAGVVGGIGVGNIVLGEKMKILATLPLFHQPGEKWTYGLNTDLLGYLIEVVSGTSLNDFFRTRIFTPLGMNDTYFYLPGAKQDRLVTLYTEQKGGGLVKTPGNYQLNGAFNPDFPATAGTYYSGGGGLSSTAYDYATFMQMLLNDGVYNGKRLLSKAAVRMMQANQIGQLKMGNGNAFGLGFEVVPQSNEGRSVFSPGSFSWGGMFSSTYWIDPKEKIIGQLFLNLYPNSHADIHAKFQALVYAAINE
jgi:CubicO group peptidase (beta-lactamase class C family)